MRPFLMPLGLAFLIAQPLHANAQAVLSAPAATTPEAVPAAAAPLTLPAAIRMAFDANPGLRAATRDLDIAAGQRIQAASRLNPELSFTSEGVQKDQRTRTVQLSQPLELGGKRAARIALADVGNDIASAELAGFRTGLRADVVTAFFDVVAAQERHQLARASQQLAQRFSQAAARRVSAGKVSPVEETRARVAEASSKIELNQASNELSLSRRRLSATWGNHSPMFGQVIAPEAAIETSPAATELMSRLPAAPQALRARLEISRQEVLTQVERSRRVADVTVLVGTQRDEQFGQDAQRRLIVGLSVPIPLFDRHQGNLLSALRRTDKARDELRVVESRLATALVEASARLNAAQSELAILRGEILPGALSAYAAAAKGFELGKFGFLDVLDAQRTLFQGKTHYVRALAESHRAAADIDRIVAHVEANGALSAPASPYQESK